MPHPKVRDLKEANALLKRMVNTADMQIKILPIPWSNLRGLLFVDASLGNTTEGRSQQGFLVCVTDHHMLSGEESNVSILTWTSHRSHRVCPSTLHSEACALSAGLAEWEYVATFFGLSTDLYYDMRARDFSNRELQVNTIMKEPDEKLKMVAVSDAKSLYDNLSREANTGAERRAALEICVCRDSLSSLGGQCRWFPHNLNPTDCLTKLKGNVGPLHELMRTSRFKLTCEEAVIQERKDYRNSTGMSNPRHRSARAVLRSGKQLFHQA
jgi:hypothetical protein